ncbi:MAG TPA: TonB-dependent siderophore receptor [Sediminibacterium sp.]|nr:TonB-dependent siderophore receptor [Sediminibacterium sp.]HQS55565.1 TonB-dependent siderophore receptor [Sediminibacterium sp.]
MKPLLFTGLCLSCILSHLQAQTDSSYIKPTIKKSSSTFKKSRFQPEADTLEAVTVHANRTNNQKSLNIGRVAIPAMDLPQAVSIVNRSVMDNQQALRLSDVIRNVNGVYLATTRGATQENFSARGYSLGANNIYKDGIRINSGSMPETSSLEKVEVLKGSSAVLFGNVAPGGIINLVSKQPKFEPGGEIAIRTGSFGLFKPHVEIYGPLSKSIAYQINGSFETADSYRDQVQSKRYYINPSLLFKLGNKTELLLITDHLQHDFTPDFGIGTIDNTSIPDLPRSAFFGTNWQYAKTKQSSATSILKHSFNDNWQLNASISWQHYNRDYFAIERIQAKANGDFYRPLNRTKNDEQYLTSQISVSGKFKTGQFQHLLLTGIDIDRYDTKAWTYNQPTIYDTINILDANKFKARTDMPNVKEIRMVATPILRFGAYIQDLITVTHQIKLMLGLRWSYQDAKPATTTDLITGKSTLGALKTDQAFSPRAGLVYQPNKHTSLFASYANSFSINSGTDVYGNALAPSIIDQFELGVKNDLLSGALTVNLTAYRIINNNLAQTALFAADGITPNNNTNLKALTGQTMSDGIEIDFTAHPLKGLDLMAGYSYNFIRYTKTPDTKGNFVEGERLQNSVGSTANGSIFYHFKAWKIGTSIVYTGPRTAGFNNTKGQTQNYNRLFPVADFTTIDLSVGYSWKRINLMAKLSNLTNTLNYYTHENYSINPIAPTQLSATIRYTFHQ